MSNTGKRARTMAYVLSAALVLTAVQPVAAAPLPVSRDVGAQSAVETVQYRRGRPTAPVKRHRGGNGAAAAAILGAVAIGAAAIAASNAEKRRQRRAEAYYYGGAPYGYAQQPYYAPQVQYYAPEPQYYDRSYQYRQPPSRWRGQAAPRIDGGSPYAVQQRRQRQVEPRWGGGRYQPDPMAGPMRQQQRQADRDWRQQQWQNQQGYTPPPGNF